MPNTLTVTQAHQKLKNKELSATELTRSCIDQIEAVDEKINAIVHRNFERALACAKEVDAKGKFDHPLTGIPFLTKDCFCEKDVPTTCASNILRNKDYKPPFESTTTRRLKDAGAISLGKSNTDEFTMGSSTETSCYGPTKTPWNVRCVAGGSSGGSAAGVAADECLFALGTDTGGSIRSPASFCSCTGLKVTYGRTSRYGAMSMASSLDTIGPLSKNVEDAALVLQTIAGKDPKDATTGDVPVPDYCAALTGSVKGLKIGMPREYFIDGMHPDVNRAVRAAADVIRDAGAMIVDVSLPHTEHALAVYYIICPSEVSSNMARYDGIRFGHTQPVTSNLIEYYFNVRSSGFGDEVKRRIMLGTFALSAGYYDAYYRQAQKVRALVKRDFDEAFATVDAIIAPVSPNLPFEVGAHAEDPLAMYLEDIFLTPVNLAGIPALSIPCGFSKESLPIGLQIMGPQWGEETVLRIGHAYENATDWHTKKPSP